MVTDPPASSMTDPRAPLGTVELRGTSDYNTARTSIFIDCQQSFFHSSRHDGGNRMLPFPTTEWGRIAEAGDPDAPGARDALTSICQAYWYPIYSFVRSRGHGPDEAADLTQDYFGRLLEGRLLVVADRAKGRFRNLLRTDCGYFLADLRDRVRARKRGGDRARLSLDADDAEGRYRLEPYDRLDAGRLFDRTWTLSLLARAMDRLAGEESRPAGGRRSNG